MSFFHDAKTDDTDCLPTELWRNIQQEERAAEGMSDSTKRVARKQTTTTPPPLTTMDEDDGDDDHNEEDERDRDACHLSLMNRPTVQHCLVSCELSFP